MHERLYINGESIVLSELQKIGEGGEAEVYTIGQGQTLKVYRQPDEWYEGDPDAQEAARRRIRTQQTKLPAFPKNLPRRVVVPLATALDAEGKIAGYTMQYLADTDPLKRYGKKSFRDRKGIDKNAIPAMFRDLHYTVSDLHEAGVVIGDFNDKNVLIQGISAYLIDADSMQFGRYATHLFQQDFLDPLLMNPQARRIEMHPEKRHSADSDWYAYNCMFAQNLLFARPYGGSYTPDPEISNKERLEQRVTIFSRDVKPPESAIHPEVLPDELLQHFQDVFEKDKRGPFPSYLLDFRWTKCINCGTEHARQRCPNHFTSQHPRHKTIPVVKSPLTKHYTSTSSSLEDIFRFNDIIFEQKLKSGLSEIRVSKILTEQSVFQSLRTIEAFSYQNDQLRYVYHEKGQYKREDGSVIYDGAFDSKNKFAIQGKNTILYNNGVHIVHDPQGEPKITRSISAYGANEEASFTVMQNRLWRKDTMGNLTSTELPKPEPVFWVGEDLGLVCTKDADGLKPAFVFDARNIQNRRAIAAPAIEGKVLDTACYPDTERLWLLTTVQTDENTTNHCTVINKQGKVIMKAKTKAGSNTWLGTIHGKAAGDSVLLSPTADGLTKVAIENRRVETTIVPDTKAIVDPLTKLVSGKDGVYASSYGIFPILKNIWHIQWRDHYVQEIIDRNLTPKERGQRRARTEIAKNMIDLIKNNTDTDQHNDKYICITAVGRALAHYAPDLVEETMSYLEANNKHAKAAWVAQALAPYKPIAVEKAMKRFEKKLPGDSDNSPVIIAAALAPHNRQAAKKARQRWKEAGMFEAGLLIDAALNPTNTDLIQTARRTFESRNDETGEEFLKELAITAYPHCPSLTYAMLDRFERKKDYDKMALTLEALLPHRSDFFEKAVERLTQVPDEFFNAARLAMLVAPYQPNFAERIMNEYSLRKNLPYSDLIAMALAPNKRAAVEDKVNNSFYGTWMAIALNPENTDLVNIGIKQLTDKGKYIFGSAVWITRALLWGQKRPEL